MSELPDRFIEELIGEAEIRCAAGQHEAMSVYHPSTGQEALACKHCAEPLYRVPDVDAR